MTHALAGYSTVVESLYVALQKRRVAKGICRRSFREAQGDPHVCDQPMPLLCGALIAAAAPARKRKGLFAAPFDRLIEARMRRPTQELQRHGHLLPRELEAGRLEDQRAQRGFAAVRALMRPFLTGMCRCGARHRAGESHFRLDNQQLAARCDIMQQAQWTHAPLPLLIGQRNRDYVALRKRLRGDSASQRRRAPWLRLHSRQSAPAESEPRPRRDCCACWTRWRHGRCAIRIRVISRDQARSATITGVTQPSSANERSSISPCDR